MYRRIMVPIDLQHVEKMTKALSTAADLARAYGASLWFVAATGEAPSRAAATPQRFAARLAEYVAEQGARLGLEVHGRALSSVDITGELDDLLVATARDVDADLIVMASHIPGVPDRLHLISSNAAHIVRHAHCSVFVVR